MTPRRRGPEDYGPDEWADLCERFADPGGSSALHPETARNPRNLPCPTCGQPDRLTPRDRAKGYRCDSCADAAEGGWPAY